MVNCFFKSAAMIVPDRWQELLHALELIISKLICDHSCPLRLEIINYTLKHRLSHEHLTFGTFVFFCDELFVQSVEATETETDTLWQHRVIKYRHGARTFQRSKIASNPSALKCAKISIMLKWVPIDSIYD